MSNFINDKILPKIMAFINTKGMQALKDGMVYSMPLLIVGSIFLILSFFPYQPVVDWFASVGLIPIFDQAYGATFNLMGMVAVVGIAYTYVKNEGFEALSAGFIALASFILLQPSFVISGTEKVNGIINKTWTSGQGMFNINEPVLFGVPVVLNPILALPFFLVPIVIGIVEYLAIYFGFAPLYSGVMVAWTTPPIISGFLIGGWRTALLQLFCLFLSFVIYLPFIRKADKMQKENESKAAQQ